MNGKHILPERLKPGLKLVFCGTAAGRQSALQKAYYAHGQNKFWRTLHEVGLTPHLFAPQEYPDLWKLGIGLTDIEKLPMAWTINCPGTVWAGRQPKPCAPAF
jgi:TDG/mug DNA glycosylase family protein